MKIGFKPKSYNDVICFDIKASYEDRQQFMDDLLTFVSADNEDAIDFLITVKSKNTEDSE